MVDLSSIGGRNLFDPQSAVQGLLSIKPALDPAHVRLLLVRRRVYLRSLAPIRVVVKL